MRASIVAYVNTCRTKLMGFVEAAYFWKYGKPIPRGALDQDVTNLVCGDEEVLPTYLVEFFFQGRKRWKVIHQAECALAQTPSH